MAESLLFRKGSLASLERATKVAGAISFTTDEPAIYLDVQENGEVVRKRIGDLIVYNTAAELIAEGNTAVNGTVGSWSKTALYYVVESNALLKWTGTKWKQINSVSDVEAEFNELDKIINGDPSVEGDTGLVGRVSTLGNEMDAAQADIEALEKAVGSVPTNSNLYDLLQEEISRSTNKDTAHDTSINDHETRIDNLETTVGDSTKGLVKDVADNKTAIQNNANAIVQINDVNNGILAQAKADATTKANAAQSAAEATAAADATSKANKALDDAKAHTNTEINKVKETLEGLTNEDIEIKKSITANAKAIADEASRADAAEKANAKAISEETTRAKAEEERLAGLISGLDSAYKTADSNLDGKITELNNTLNEYKTNQETEHTNIRTDFAAADTALETKLKGYIDTNMATADAMKYMGVVNSASDLPTTTSTGVEAGWTYKVGTDFAANDKINTDEAVILKGDLLIASTDLAEGVTIPNDFWHHISSGYEDDKDQILVGSTVAASGTQTAGAQVILQSHTGDDRGSVAIVGTTNSNVRVTSAVTVDNEQTGDTSTVITLGLEWGTF